MGLMNGVGAGAGAAVAAGTGAGPLKHFVEMDFQVSDMISVGMTNDLNSTVT